MTEVTLKVVDRLSEAPDKAPVYCEVCGSATRAGKPFCSAHVEQSPYVSSLLERLESREREQKAVMAGNLRAIDLSGDTAGEIYDQLSYYGSRSVPRLARDLNHPSPLVLRYLRAFQRAGYPVEISISPRGKPMARIMRFDEVAAARYRKAV